MEGEEKCEADVTMKVGERRGEMNRKLVQF
jgi:hypothetical protein